ncbi:hypothetical protein DPX16_9921 [Anabarilius grahami]|uniref:Uncharacterized protein n=1 Tax=Anabarilius grahami TaxID=495550 RepID=A0A3N0Y418_ANAGA|nr:hypothetical protein DPX16_9921 [Anabarilius grahami]
MTESLLYLALVNEVHSFIRAHLQRHELHSSRLLDYRITQIKASAAPSHCHNRTALKKNVNGGCNKECSASKRYRCCQRSKAFLEPRQRQV